MINPTTPSAWAPQLTEHPGPVHQNLPYLPEHPRVLREKLKHNKLVSNASVACGWWKWRFPHANTEGQHRSQTDHHLRRACEPSQIQLVGKESLPHCLVFLFLQMILCARSVAVHSFVAFFFFRFWMIERLKSASWRDLFALRLRTSRKASLVAVRALCLPNTQTRRLRQDKLKCLLSLKFASRSTVAMGCRGLSGSIKNHPVDSVECGCVTTQVQPIWCSPHPEKEVDLTSFLSQPKLRVNCHVQLRVKLFTESRF